MEIRFRPIADLKVSELNVRQHVNREQFERLKASLFAVWQEYKRILESLGVREDGTIIYGKLRFLALTELIDEGKLPADIRVPCVDEKEIDDKTARLFSLIENIAVVPLEHSDKVAAIKHLIGKKEYGDISKVSRLLGTTSATVGRWLALEEQAPLLARLGEEAGVGERKLDFVKKIVEETPSLRGKQESLVKAAGEIPRARLESMAAESTAGFTIKPKVEAELAKTSRLQTLFMKDDLWKYLGMYSREVNRTISELVEEALKAHNPFLDFLKTKELSVKSD